MQNLEKVEDTLCYSVLNTLHVGWSLCPPFPAYLKDWIHHGHVMKLPCPSNLLQTFCYWSLQIQEFDSVSSSFVLSWANNVLIGTLPIFVSGPILYWIKTEPFCRISCVAFFNELFFVRVENFMAKRIKSNPVQNRTRNENWKCTDEYINSLW